MKTIMTAVLGLSMLALSGFAAQDVPKTAAPKADSTKSTTPKVKKHKKSVKSTTPAAPAAPAAK